MSLYHNTTVFSYVINDIRERLSHFVMQTSAEGHHYYRLRLPVGEDGRAVLTGEDIADVLFEERIFHLNASERKAARCDRAIALRRQAYKNGKVVSFADYRREKYTWPEIDPEMYELVERLEREAEAAKSTAAVVLPEEVPGDRDIVAVATKEQDDSNKDNRTAVKKLLDETEDESIRKQIEVIFDLNPELEALANNDGCVLQLSIVDGKVSVGSARFLKTGNA